MSCPFFRSSPRRPPLDFVPYNELRTGPLTAFFNTPSIFWRRKLWISCKCFVLQLSSFKTSIIVCKDQQELLGKGRGLSPQDCCEGWSSPEVASPGSNTILCPAKGLLLSLILYFHHMPFPAHQSQVTCRGGESPKRRAELPDDKSQMINYPGEIQLSIFKYT